MVHAYLSFASVSTKPILLTTPMPFFILPKIVCLPESKQIIGSYNIYWSYYIILSEDAAGNRTPVLLHLSRCFLKLTTWWLCALESLQALSHIFWRSDSEVCSEVPKFAGELQTFVTKFKMNLASSKQTSELCWRQSSLKRDSKLAWLSTFGNKIDNDSFEKIYRSHRTLAANHIEITTGNRWFRWNILW